MPHEGPYVELGQWYPTFIPRHTELYTSGYKSGFAPQNGPQKLKGPASTAALTKTFLQGKGDYVAYGNGWVSRTFSWTCHAQSPWEICLKELHLSK